MGAGGCEKRVIKKSLRDLEGAPIDEEDGLGVMTAR